MKELTAITWTIQAPETIEEPPLPMDVYTGKWST